MTATPTCPQPLLQPVGCFPEAMTYPLPTTHFSFLLPAHPLTPPTSPPEPPLAPCPLCRSLAADTVGLRSAVDVVLRYEQRSDAALIKLLGRSYTLEDAAFYGAGVLGVVAAGAVPGGARARLPVLALLCSALVGERLVLQRLHMVLERDPADEVRCTKEGLGGWRGCSLCCGRGLWALCWAMLL